MENTASRFEQLGHDMAQAARISFAAYRQQHRDEDFYAFALYTDQDALGPTPAVSTEQSLARAIERNVGAVYDVSEIALLRYVPDEWAYLGAEGNPEDWHAIWETVDELSEDDSMPFPTFRHKIWQALILALKDLDGEGFFGTGEERERVTLLIWPSQASEAEQWWIRSVRELNPETVWKRFLSELPPSCEEALAADARFVQEVIRRILERLRQDMAKAARNTFASYREQHPGEDFCAFGVVTDANVRTWVPVANTEQSMEEAIQEYINDGEEVPELSQMRYCPMKWGISGDEGEGKQAWRGIRAMQNVLREYPGLSAEVYRDKVLEAMLLALKDLDAEGFFGTGAERERIILLVWTHKAEDCRQWWLRSARELNPQAVYERFASELPP